MNTAALLNLAHLGLRLFPVAPRGKNPLLQDWPNQASDTDEQIQFWAKRWANCPPAAWPKRT